MARGVCEGDTVMCCMGGSSFSAILAFRVPRDIGSGYGHGRGVDQCWSEMGKWNISSVAS